ncbi:MAG: phosphate ABC transporter substrate-binding/OmpA family protein [Pirellulaceae bacterium]
MSKGKLLAVCIVWLMILGVGVLVWRFAFVPRRDAARDRQDQAARDKEAADRANRRKIGSSPSRYRFDLDFRLDAFSGYALIRSPDLKNALGTKGIRLNLRDDKADYPARLRALQSGDAHMAVFTIDALIKASSELGELPATIVAIVDETVGADAIVAYKSTVPNIDALNRADMRFVLTPNSPSETLARVVLSRFDLDNVGPDPFVRTDSVEEVMRRYEAAKPGDPLAYVLWEPFVSHVLKNKATQVVVDSSRFPSTIVDVIVAGDDTISKNPEIARDFVECYLRTVYSYRERSAMVRLVMEDARKESAPLSEQEADKIVDGIWWKNTQENLAHMGLLPDTKLSHIEDMIGNITDVLVSTGGIQRDPTDGNPGLLFYASVLDELRDFHPGSEPEDVREIELPALSDAEWDQLSTVGTARVPPLVFARGTDRLTGHSRVLLDELANRLATTRFYVVIRGNASRRGDLEQNKVLAEKRAKAAERHLIDRGVPSHRIRAVGVEPSGSTSVTFMLGQLPY